MIAEQKVTPSDDALIRRAVLPDGILAGCGLTYSGSTLTMAAGALMVCGRQIRHPAAQNWAVVDATSGYARLLLTIDLTRTATKDAFDQVLDSIEYASSVDGFPALEQADINGSGTRFQIVLCVVSLGTGGISGIVSQLGMTAAASKSYVDSKHVVLTVTVPASGWYQFGAGYECQVSVPGLLVDDTPVVDLNMSGDGAVYAESNIALCDEYGKIFRAIAGADTMWIQATDIPGADLPIKIKVVR